MSEGKGTPPQELGELEELAGRSTGLGGLGPVVDAVRRFHAPDASDDARARALVDSYRELTRNAAVVIEQQLAQVDEVLAKLPVEHPERAAVVRMQRIFQRQRLGLDRLREFLERGDERLLGEAQELLTLDDAGAPVGGAAPG